MIDHSNPLAVSLPYTFNSQNDYPTEILANRFQGWRSIIKDLVNYLREFASVQEEIIRQQQRLQQAVGSVAPTSGQSNHGHVPLLLDLAATDKYFLPIGNGSIQDLPSILTKFHQQNVTNGSKTLKDINNIIIPKLEDLRKDLLVKIKEIKNLQNDFKTNLGKEVQETKTLLQQYQHAIDLSNKLEHGTSPNQSHLHLPGTSAGSITSGGIDGSSEQSKYDPYLVKVRLDRQLKRQLNEENYLYEAYANLQNSGGKLESIVVLEIQNYLGMFLNLVEVEHSTIPNFLIPNINQGFLTKDPGFEWDSFISRHLPTQSAIQQQTVGGSGGQLKSGTFIDLHFPARKMLDLQIPNFDTPLNVSVRESLLERRSKFLKSYSSGWYVLTCNYIHEFKSPDRKKDPTPVMSLLLDACLVSEHSKDDGKSSGVYKFVLYSKGLNIRHRSHNWVFRTNTYQNMIDWYNDIKSLTSLATPAARARWVNKKTGGKHNFSTGGTHTGTGTSKVSRNSSVISTGTNGRTIKSIETVETGRVAQSIRSTNPRLSSTFSNKNNNLPRLPNMINSDGTIITPVESTVGQEEYLRNIQKAQDQQGPAPAHVQMKVPAHHQQPPQPQSATTTPQLYVYPGGYYINGAAVPQLQVPGQVPANGQPQQYYDPVQQQYFTISPTAPPQPQYFPPSPQPPSQQQFYVPANGQANGQPQPQPQSQPQQAHAQAGQAGQQPGQVYINTAHYFPQSPQSQPQYNDVTSLGSYLPYPGSVLPTTTIPVSYDDHKITTTQSNNKIEKNGDIVISREDLHDEVDTLPSVGSDKE